jgi:hypothetical protein
MFEQKELYNDGLHSNYGQREGAIVLVCTGAGKIGISIPIQFSFMEILPSLR